MTEDMEKKQELIEKIRYILLLEDDDNCIDLMCYYLSYMYDCDDNLEDYIKKISEKIKNNLESLEKEASKKIDEYFKIKSEKDWLDNNKSQGD